MIGSLKDEMFTVVWVCGYRAVGYMCYWMIKVSTKTEKILRDNSVMPLFLLQIGVVPFAVKMLRYI